MNTFIFNIFLTNLHKCINICIMKWIGPFLSAQAYESINFLMHMFIQICLDISLRLLSDEKAVE